LFLRFEIKPKKEKKRKKEKSIPRDYNPKIAIINSNKYHLRFIQLMN